MSFNINISDNSPKVLEALDRQKKAMLEEIGMRYEDNAKKEAPVGDYNIVEDAPYQGGSLRKSITHKVIDDTVYVGTNIKAKVNKYNSKGEVIGQSEISYGIYQELGTGIYATDGKGRKSPWYFYNRKGKRIRMTGLMPKHFMRNAGEKHRSVYKRIIEKYLKDK